MPRGPILLARHPRPLTGARFCLGRRDVDLAEPAELGAERLLAAAGAARIERIISSPLRRALEVGRVVALWTGAPLHADDRLTEQDFGSWDGLAWTALPRAELAAWEADKVRLRAGGGESLDDVLRRVRHAWTRIASAEETTLVLSHAAPIQCLLHLGAGLTLDPAAASSVGYGAVIPLP